MIDGVVVVDAVVHPWNRSPENQNLDGMRPYISDVLMKLEGVQWVSVQQTLENLWSPERVLEPAAASR